MTILAPFESTRGHVCVLFAIEALDIEAKVLKDSTDFAVATFTDTDHDVGLIRRVDGYVAGLRWTILEFDSCGNGTRLVRTQRLVQDGLVHAKNSVAWVHQAICELTIIGEQQDSRCIAIKAANCEEARFEAHYIEHRGTTLFVAGCRDHVLWLIEHDVRQVLIPRNRLAIDRDHVVDLNLGAKLCDNTTVDLDRTGADQIISMTSRRNTGVGNGLVKTLWRVGRLILAVSLGLLARRRCVLLL